jgi:alcohol dehydrogenase class IV
MQIFKYPKIIFGNNSIEALPSEISLLGKEHCCAENKRILIITDRNLKQYTKIPGRIEDLVRKTGKSYDIFDELIGEPEINDARRITEIARNNEYCMVIGVGGGSVLDVAKIASVMATNNGEVEEYLTGTRVIHNRGLPKILIPTTSGSGSEVSYAAVIHYRDVKQTLRDPYLIADTAIIDPLLTISMPPSVTASSGLDALSHAVETYVSKTSTPLSDSLSLKAVQLILKNLPQAYAHGNDLTARHNMSLASLMAEMAATSGAGGVCLPHAISHCLPKKCSLPHGILCAIILPYFLELALPCMPKDKVKEFIENIKPISSVTDGRDLVTLFKNFNKIFGVPDTIPGLRHEDIPQIIDRIYIYGKRQIDRTPFDVTKEILEALLEKLIVKLAGTG